VPIAISAMPALVSSATMSPVVFIDTCTFLDVLRQPFRAKDPQTAKSTIDSAKRFLAAASAVAPLVHLVTAEIVVKEWSDNLPTVATELTRHIDNVESSLERLSSCGPLLIDPAHIFAAIKGARTNADTLQPLAEQLIAASHVISSNPAIREAAYNREVQGLGPAKKGKQCIKDCTVAETLIQMTEELRTNGFGGAVLLVTSNTQDFTDGGLRPHVDLQGDFTKLRIGLATTWPHAAHSVGI